MNTYPTCVHCGRQYIATAVYDEAHDLTHYCADCQGLYYLGWQLRPPMAQTHAHTSTVLPTTHSHNSTQHHIESPVRSRTQPPPSSGHSAQFVQALHLRAHSSNPTFIQVALRTVQAGSVPEPDLRSLFQPGVLLDSQIFHTQVDGTPVRYPLQIFYRSNFLQDGSPLNQCVRSMVHGQAVYPWAGDIIVLKFSGTRMRGYTNMTDNDIPPLGYYFLYTQFEN